MTLEYPVRLIPAEEGGFVVQGLPPLDGVITQGEDLEDAKEMARDALNGALAVMLDRNIPIPKPPHAEAAQDIIFIEPDPDIAAPILLRWARQEANLTLGELAKRLGITYQSVQRLERPGANPSLKTLAKVARALGKELHIAL